MYHPRRLSLFIATVALVTLTAGCGGSDGSDGSDAESASSDVETSEVTAAEQADTDAAEPAAGDSSIIGDDLCPQFEGETIAGIGPLVIQNDGLLSETMRQCSYTVDDGTSGLQFAVSTVSGAGNYASMVATGGAEQIDGLGSAAVAITAQDVRVETSSGPELIVTAFDYQNPNEQGTFADLEKSEEVARLLIETLGLG